MLSTLCKLSFKQNLKGLSSVAPKCFGTHAQVGKETVLHEVTQTETDLNVESSYKVGPSVHGDVTKIPKILDCAHLNYRKYPNVAHNDPHSPEYVASERDEYQDKVRTTAYNRIIDRLKSDLQMQSDVYEVVENLDRSSYRRGIPGVTKNITGGVRDYFPPGDLGFHPRRERDDEKFFDEHYNNVDRWRNEAVFYPKFAPIESDLQWQYEYENRPINRHFHPEKGYKYDVEVPYDQRHPHVADRMGYPEILGTPWERLLRLEGEIYHPTYLDQPFVQVPHSDPHPSLDFEEGEVVYENAKILEWAKFWNLTGASIYTFAAFFVPYNLLYKTHMPLSSAYDNLFTPYYMQTMFFFDSWTFHAPLIGMFAGYVTYVGLALSHTFWKDYVVKLQYSKDKELLFVTRISPYCSLEEEVYEVHHLEILPPSVKAGVAHLSSQDDDGLWDINCLASHRNLVVSNEDKYWNTSLKKEFFDKVMNFWTPDVIKPSRAEELKEAAFGAKIELGAGRGNPDESIKTIELKKKPQTENKEEQH